MTKEKALQPIEQKTVEFYEDEITAVRLKDGAIYIPIRPICVYLGVDWSAQRKRITGNVVMNESVHSVAVTATEAGGKRDMLCLPLKFIPGWLFGINPARIKNITIREKIIRYQRECYDVLSEAFQKGRLTADPSFSELLEQDTPAAQAYKVIQAVLKIAEQQVLLESRVTSHDRRLESIESQLGDPGRAVTPDQAMQISQGVKAIALVTSKRSGRNEYGGVYGELYRKFGITSYKLLPATDFEACMGWLRNWWQELTDDGVPF